VDQEDLLYWRGNPDSHKLDVPKSLIEDVIRANHYLSYVALPGIKRTHDVTALNSWWPGMRRTIEDYVQKCDCCRRGKEDWQFTAPLCSTELTKRPFQITSMDVTGLYPLTPRCKKYLPTFVDRFSMYAEVYAIPEDTAGVCARV
jgi:uncharacterized protein YqcC (DUF446 family)